MIDVAHAIIYSQDAEADRKFLTDMLGLRSVDAGGRWLIFGLPPSEVAVHSDEAGKPGHELYLLYDDLDATVSDLETKVVTVESGSTTNPGSFGCLSGCLARASSGSTSHDIRAR